jgi:hypothetical protein
MPFTTTVTPANIAIAAGKPTPSTGSDTEQQWQMWIDDALMLINDRATKQGVTTIDQVKIDYVIREAVVDHVKRPDDATQVTVSVDDGSTSKLYRSGAGRVRILDEWWSMLGLTELSGAFSLDMAPSCSAHLAWCSLMLGANYCSCGVDIAGEPIYEGDY